MLRDDWRKWQPHDNIGFPRRLKRLLKKSEKQIPRGLKPTRNDKKKGLVRRTLRQAQGRL